MELRERVKRVQEPLLKAISAPRAALLGHDTLVALAELAALLGELCAAVEALQKGGKHGNDDRAG